MRNEFTTRTISDSNVCNGGVIGKITAVDESFAEVEVASGVVVKLQKQGINQKMPKGSAKSMSKSSSKASSKAKASPKEKLTEKKETKK